MIEMTVKDIYEMILDEGDELQVRGSEVREVRHFRCAILNPFSNYVHRKYPVDYLRREFQWFLNADPKDHRICGHAKMWAKLIQEDGSIFSNYGYLWFGKRLKNNLSAFEYVIAELIRDTYSRRAVIPMLSVDHMFEGNQDQVCTKSITFSLRDGELSMSVDMRSSDAVFGLATDLPCFYWLQKMVALKLGVKVGKFIFAADNIHIYQRHYQMAGKVCNDPSRESLYVPEMDNVDDLLSGRFESDFGKWLTEVKL